MVLPDSNLPEPSKPWGREIERLAKKNEEDTGILTGQIRDVESASRAAVSASSLLAQKVDEQAVQPAKVTGLGGTTEAAYDTVGFLSATISLYWAPAEHASSYQVVGGPVGAAAGVLGQVVGSFAEDLPDIVLSGLLPDTEYHFEVRARSTMGVWGPYSDVFTIETPAASDVDLPNPSTPALTSSLSAVLAAWDGLDSEGDPMPKWVQGVETHYRINGGAWLSGGQFLYSAGDSVVAGLTPGDTIDVYFTALTTWGEAEDSALASIVVEGIDLGTIDAELAQLQTDLEALDTELAAAQTELDGVAIVAADAQSTADAAQTTANGKNTVWYQTSAPAGTTHKLHDIWYDTDDGFKMYRWPGGAGPWTAAMLGTNALSDNIINAAKLADNAVTTGKILNGAVDSTKLATAVNTAISTAQSTATAAQGTANSAASAASAAQSDADAAQADADAAAAAAATAAGIANGKGKVLVQSTAPGADDRNAQTLWIDTTGGANTPKRWVSGTTWSAVTDKVATDAASAAASAASAASAAQSTANSATTLANAAQTAANAAASAASSAQTAADNAQTTANGKNKIVRSASAASSPGSYIAGDQWWQYSGSQIIAMWLHSGSAWVSQTLTDSVITNLNAGSITAGTIAAARLSAVNIKAVLVSAGAIETANIAAGAITAASGIIADAAIGTAKIIDGNITTAKIANLAVTDAKIATLDAAKITTGYLDAARIQANTISVEKLIVSDLTNLFETPDFEQFADGATPPNVTFGATGGRVKDISAYSGGNGSTRAFEVDARNGSNTDLYFGPLIPVQPGQKFHVRFDGRYLNTAGTIGSGKIGFRTYNPSKGGLSWVTAAQMAATPKSLVFTEYTGAYEVTAGVGFVQVWVSFGNNGETTNKAYFDNIEIRRMSGGSLIVDGAITTDHMTANTINGDRITAGTLAANKIVANSITAGQIATNAITADELAANSVVATSIVAGQLTAHIVNGNVLSTATAANRGIEITNTGFTAYNASGVPTVSIVSSTGAATFTGDFISGSGNSIFKATTSGIQLGHATFGSAPFRVTAAGVLTATSANITGTINATSGTFTGTVNATGGTFSGAITLTGLITASGTSSTTGFIAYDTGTNVASTLDPRGLSFYYPSAGGMTLGIRTKRDYGTDSVIAGTAEMEFINTDSQVALEIGKWAADGWSYMARMTSVQVTSLILANHPTRRVNNTTIAETTLPYAATGSAGLPTGTGMNNGEIAYVNSPDNWVAGFYEYWGGAWSQIVPSYPPAFKIYGTALNNTTMIGPSTNWNHVGTNPFGNTSASAEWIRGFTWSAGVLTAQQAGIYQINVALNFSTTATPLRRWVRVLKNSTTASTWTDVVVAATATDHNVVAASGTVRLEAGDTLRIYATHAAAGNNTLEAVRGTYFDVSWVGPHYG